MRTTKGRPSDLGRLEEPEVSGDRFYRAIRRVAATEGVSRILEIGAASGEGSARVLVEGALQNPSRPTIHGLEVSRVRFRALERRYADLDFVHSHNLSSVPLGAFPDEEEVRTFYETRRSRLRRTPLPEVIRWLRQGLEYLERRDLTEWGIRRIRERYGIQRFDAVLFDGSEFTGPAELEEVHRARFLLLDDIGTYKNDANFRRLRADPSYRLRWAWHWVRNGFAVFERGGGERRPGEADEGLRGWIRRLWRRMTE